MIVRPQREGLLVSITTVGPEQKVSLSKGEGTVDVYFSWSTPVDVDLACMYELSDGTKGTVQALKPNPNFGNLRHRPFIRLRNDDRTGQKKGGGEELLQINLAHASAIRKLLVFAYVFDRGGTWRTVRNGAVNIGHPTQGNFDFRVGRNRYGLPRRGRRTSRSCVLLTMERSSQGDLEMTLRGTYFKGTHQQISDAYGMGIVFTPNGYKD